MAVYTLNCIYRIYTILSVYDNTEQWTGSLTQQSSSYIDTLVAEQARALLIKSGLRTVVTLMQTWETEVSARVGGAHTQTHARACTFSLSRSLSFLLSG